MAPRRVLTDRKVGTKIMVAVGLVALFGAAGGLYALDSVGATNQQVKTGYVHEQELAAIGDLRAAVNRVWLGVDDARLAGDATERAAAGTAISTARSQVDTNAQAYRAFPIGAEAGAAIAGFDTHWQAYESLLENNALPLIEDGDRAGVASARCRRPSPPTGSEDRQAYIRQNIDDSGKEA